MHLQHALDLAAPYLQDYGYPAVFVSLFVESFGIPAPGESMLIAAAVLAGRGELDLRLVIVIAWCAAVAGDNVGYAIGRFGGRRIVNRWGGRLGLTDERIGTAEEFFRRFGGGVVIVARFFLVLRQLNGVVAGTVHMPWWRFLAYNAVGAALWVGAWSLGGTVVGEYLGAFSSWFHRFGWLWPLAGVAVVVVLIIRYRRRHGEHGRPDAQESREHKR